MDVAFLAGTRQFSGLTKDEITHVLHCLGAHTRAYQRDEVICPAGGVTGFIGMVLEGSVLIDFQDAWGNRTLLSHIGPGDTYAEIFALIPGEVMPVSVVAATSCVVLRLQAAKLGQVCANACGFHSRMVSNLLQVLAQRNLNLTRRMFHTTPKTIRAKLTSYLSYEATRARSRSFDIPYDRQQLADYLGVDRSALSSELGKMRREKLLTCRRNRFELSEGITPADA